MRLKPVMVNPREPINIRSVLQTSLFGRLGAELLEEVAQQARIERYDVPTLLCPAGTLLQRLRLVVAGRIELVARTSSGKALTISDVEPGDWASWLPCFMPVAPEHDLCAAADSIFVALPVAAVRGFCECHPQLYPLVIAEIGHRLRLLTEWAGQSVLMGPEQRMAKLIVLMALDKKAGLSAHTLNVTQCRLASLARCSRQSGNLLLRAPPDGLAIHVFVNEQQRETALALHPAFVEKLLWGGKVVGLRVSLEKARPAVVRQWVLFAWQLKAPASKGKAAPSSPPGKQPEFDWHSDPITPVTPVDSAYKTTQNVRRFLTAQCGAAVKFDRAFMQWTRNGEPKSMGDVALEWTRRRGVA